MFATIVALGVAAFGLSIGAQVEGDQLEGNGENDKSTPLPPPENPIKPRWHFRVRDPANLTGDEAEKVYRRLKAVMAARYRLSRLAVARKYQNWRRYNLAPYRSVTHGQRFVNNYANARARAYGKFESAGRLPVGSIIAKDSFSVKEDGSVRPGPLFVMEKMPEGSSYVSGDWLYTMVMPDGSMFGQSKGPEAARMEFCIACHLVKEKHDHLFFVPKGFRR